MSAHFILYVSNQEDSTRFFASVLGMEPRLHVPGMTEFALSGGAILGLMPEKGIKALLGAKLPDPARAMGVPRAELYLRVADPGAHHARALAAGALELSPLLARDWGDVVAYSLIKDGLVLAFATAHEDPLAA